MELRVVTRDEWVDARKDLLIKEKALTRAHDALSAERRHLPMVKIDKNYVFETPSGKRTLAELFDGKSQADHLSLHDGTGLDRRLPELLAPRRHHRRQHRPPRAPRRHPDGDLARAAGGHRSLQTAHGLAVPVGVVFRLRLQPRLRRVVHGRGDCERPRHLQLRAGARSRSRRGRA